MNQWIRPRGHDIAVLFSERSRKAYADDAASKAQTYTFTDAWGKPRTWLKGGVRLPGAQRRQPAAGPLQFEKLMTSSGNKTWTTKVLAVIRLLLVPNAAHLAQATIARIEALAGGHRKTSCSSPAEPTCRRRCSASPRAPRVAGARLHRLALAARIAVRKRCVGEILCQRLRGPRSAARRTGRGRPGAGRTAGILR